MGYRKYLLILLVLLILLPGCITPAKTFPTEGIWYCKELNITLDFVAGTGYITLNEEDIFCVIANNRGSKFISILNQNEDTEEFYLGESVFSGKCIRYDNKELVIGESKTETVYTFYRTDNSIS